MDSSSTQNLNDEVLQTRVLHTEDWIKKWENRNIQFHQHNVHKLLSEFLEVMVNNRSKLNIFFPFCGKAVDMKWLADLGHNIIGVDVAEIGLKEFFEEQNISYTEDTVPAIPGAKVFKSTSGNISLYCCNIYDLSDSIVNKFDGIWDRGGLVAVNPNDRERYTNLLLSLMNEDCRYLLVTVEYDPKLVKGPPFYVSDAKLQALMGSLCSIQGLKVVDALTEIQKGWGLDFFQEKIYLIKLNSNF